MYHKNERRSRSNELIQQLPAVFLPLTCEQTLVNAFPTGSAEFAGLFLTLPFDAKRQSGKMWIKTFEYLVWPDAESNPNLSIITVT